MRPSSLLVRRQLCGRDGLEPLVGDRLAALDRDAVGSGGNSLLGSLDCGELLAKIELAPLVELVLIQVGCQVRSIELVRGLAVIPLAEPRQRTLDPRALGRQKLACPIGVHNLQLRRSARIGQRASRRVAFARIARGRWLQGLGSDSIGFDRVSGG
jgi:hypothetical protein